jgi:hypothetical protein
MREYLYLGKWGLEKLPAGPPATAAARYLTPDGRCIFAESGGLTGVQKSEIRGYKDYDEDVEWQRRLVCDSALGQLVLDNPGAAHLAVRQVNLGIRDFVHELHRSEIFNMEFKPGVSLGQQAVGTDGKYVSNATSFGRLDRVREEQLSDVAKRRVPSAGDQKARQLRGQMNTWLAAFNEPDLARQMGLHDLFLKVHCSLLSANGARPNLTPKQLATEEGLREDWYDSRERGRKDNPEFNKKPFSSKQPGLIGPKITIPWQEMLGRAGVNLATMRQEERQRAVDRNLRDAENMQREYGEILDRNRLLFVASASGTTSTLLTSAYLFAPAVKSDAELKRKYLLACVGYLVGGGMHSCDEVFFTGGKAGLPYTPGKYLGMLPQSFLNSEAGQLWQTEFWEFVRPDRTTPR